MTKKNHKDRFISMFGQEQWDLAMDYFNKGDRSPEATNAKKFYSRLHQGLIDPTYTVYDIYHNGESVYVGMTSTTIKQRWNVHKYCVKEGRNSNLYRFMRENTSNPKKFPEFQIVARHVLNDFDIARELERLIIEVEQPTLNMNKGGSSSTPTLKMTPEEPLVPFGFAVKHKESK